MNTADDFGNSVTELKNAAQGVKQELLGSEQVEQDLQRRLSDLTDRNYSEEPNGARFLEVSRQTLDHMRRKIDQFEDRWNKGAHQKQAEVELGKVKTELRELLGDQIFFGMIEDTAA